MSVANFIHTIKKQFQSNTVIGLEVLLEEGDLRFHLVELQRKKELLLTEKKLSNLSWKTLEKEVDKTLPLHLVLNGRGILHKYFEHYDQNDSQILQTVLPNADSKDFCLQKVKIASGAIASLIRKSQLEEILQQFEEKGYSVCRVSLGSFAIQTLATALAPSEKIFTEQQTLSFNAQHQLEKWTGNSEENNPEIELGDEKINSFLLPAYAAAFTELMDMPFGIQLDRITKSRNEYQQKRIFQFSKQVIAAAFLTTLLVNTFFYYHYKNKNQAIKSQMVNVDYQLANLDSLKVKLNRQKDLLKHTSVHQNTSTSFYADQIASSLPDGIQLELLDIFPAKGKKVNRRKNELTKYDKTKINIKGACNSSLTYNKWLKELQAMSWVETAQHINYQDLSNKLSTFELKLTLKLSK